MNRNIMEALNATPQGGSPQHGFPLSNFVDYHKKGGQFMVVGVRDTVPNATYRMAVDGFTRTLPTDKHYAKLMQEEHEQSNNSP